MARTERPYSGVKSSKKSVETLWQALFILISITSAVLLQKIYLFQTLDYFKDIRKGHFVDLLWGVLFAVVIHTYEHYLHQVLNPWVMDHYIRFDKYKEPEDRKRRCHTLAKMIYSLFYYALSSLFSYLLICNTTMMPTWLGGNGQCINAYNKYPFFTEENLGMKIFYLVTFGKNLNRLITHSFVRSEGAFYEYLLHHGLATFLIFFSYLMNLWLIGIFIIFLHDLSELALVTCRLYSDYRNRINWVLQVMSVSFFSVWVGPRIVIHVYCCCYAMYEAFEFFPKNLSPLELEIVKMPLAFMGYMLCALWVLNIFWTYFIVKAFVAVNITKKS